MLEMTGQEKRAVLFLSAAILVGSALNLYFKANPQKKDIFRIEELNPKVNINLAGTEELVKIKGIGPVTAANIITYRKTRGPFRQVEELRQVRGVSE